MIDTNHNTQDVDLEAVNALICLWVRRMTDSAVEGSPDFASSALCDALDLTIGRAEAAGVSIELGFGAGVELGIRAAMAIVSSGLGNPTNALRDAIAEAGRVLDDSSADEERFGRKTV